MRILNQKTGYSILLLTLSTFQNGYTNTFGDIDIMFTNDDNLTRSDYGPDKKSSTYIDVYADYGKFFDHDNNWSSTVLGFVQLRNNTSYSKLSSTGIGVSASVGKKLGLGAYSSSISANLSYSSNSVTDAKRTNTLLEAGLGWNKRLNDDWELAAGAAIDNSDSKNSVFDTSGTTYYFSADYTINESLLINLGLSVRQGDIISINSGSNPNITNIINGSYGNSVSDDAYGSGLTAYRISSSTTIFQLGMSYAIDDYSAFNLGYEHQASKLSYGVTYNNNIFRANYIYSF